MIKFPCRCGFIFEMPTDMAGTMVQCPKCRVLNDVPSMHELANLAADGTYRVGEAPTAPSRMGELYQIYGTHGHDEQGEEIDLRPTFEQVAAAGVEGIRITDEIPSTAPPRYDPETGERIRPLPISPSDDDALPRETGITPGRAVLQYASATPHGRAKPVSVFQPLIGLLHVNNLIVMVFVLFAQLLLAGMFFTLPETIITVILWFPIIITLIAHYANVIEDIGPDDRDFLPRLGRQASFHEDLWQPFVNVSVAVGYCFGPAWLIWMFGAPISHINQIIALCFLAAGALIFPAVLLTTTTSGSVLNLRLDRVLGVIGHIGPFYLLLVPLMAASLGLYLAAAMISTLGITVFSWSVNWIIWLPALCVSIYFAHYCCWALGLLYRSHHEQFNWVLQRHIRSYAPPVAPMIPMAKVAPAAPRRPPPHISAHP